MHLINSAVLGGLEVKILAFQCHDPGSMPGVGKNFEKSVAYREELYDI